MKRWGIRTIALYSHDGQRRDLPFKLGRVNIITGDSHTGKSAIAEVIDYCMGSSECHLPPFIRDRLNWAAMLWERDDAAFVIARSVTTTGEAAPQYMYWNRGSTKTLRLPQASSGFKDTGTVGTVLRLLEEEIGMGAAVGETFSPTRPSPIVSARQLMPYLLQDDDVIINKTVLLRGSQDKRAIGIIDSLPYFLKVSDESSAQLEAEYRRLVRKRAVEDRRAQDRQRLVADEHDRAFALCAEAAELGLMSEQPPKNLDEARQRLGEVAKWTPGSRAETGNASPLVRLYQEETSVRSGIARMRSQIRQSEEILGAAGGFEEATRKQVRKLDQIDLFRDNSEHRACPVCQSDVSDLGPTVKALRDAQATLTEDVRSIERARPQLDGFVAARRADVDTHLERLRVVREQIRSATTASDGEQGRLDLDHRRSRVVGRITLYLESQKPDETVPAEAPGALDARIKELEASLDLEAKRDRLETAQQTIGTIATKVLAPLPFEAEYEDPSVYFLARSLECGILTEGKRVPMRDVGSDENYLSLHLAVLLAFHRFFYRRRVPVPGVLLLDQISRPYYPPDETDEVQVVESEDAAALRKYFAAIHDEAEREGLQFIVLEHAFLKGDPRFMESVVERWSKTGLKLVPPDWPTA